AAHEWPPPHPVLDAAYGPRYAPPAPPPDAPPPTTPGGWVQGPLPAPPRSRKWIGIFVVVCLLVVGGGGLLVFTFLNNKDYPGHWDPRVKDLAAFVEQATGLKYLHPVRVHFLDDAAFTKLVTTDAATLTQAQKDAISQQEAVGRAFGWFSGDTKVFDSNN